MAGQRLLHPGGIVCAAVLGITAGVGDGPHSYNSKRKRLKSLNDSLNNSVKRPYVREHEAQCFSWMLRVQCRGKAALKGHGDGAIHQLWPWLQQPRPQI